MRQTCLKCGHQIELATTAGALNGSCICGEGYIYPNVVDTGVRPNAKAAERSRYRAFRAAGIVKNVGGFALSLALLGILCFPMALAGAVVGLYVLTMLRGPLGRYSGRSQAAWAVAVGIVVFVSEGSYFYSWLKSSRMADMQLRQDSAAEDLRALLRAERLYRATHEGYGTFREFHFQPVSGQYTIYLGTDDFTPAVRDRGQVVDPLPKNMAPGISPEAFTAVAVANLDGDGDLDVWTLTSDGTILQSQNDADVR
jgi:hypothetical protein